MWACRLYTSIVVCRPDIHANKCVCSNCVKTHVRSNAVTAINTLYQSGLKAKRLMNYKEMDFSFVSHWVTVTRAGGVFASTGELQPQL